MKQMSENKQIFIATIINYITFGINILIAIFYTPFLLKTLGDSDYGIRAFATSFVTYTNLIGSGVAAAYLRFANIKKKEHGEEGVKDVDGIFLKIFLILGIINLVIGGILFLLFFGKVIPLHGYTNTQVFVVATVVLLSFITLGIKLPASVFILILNFKRKFIFRNTRYLLSSVFEYALSMVCLLLGITVFKSQVIALSIVSLISEVLFSLITFFYLFSLLKHRLNFKQKVVEKTIWKDIIKFSALALLIVAVMTLNDSTDRIILGFISPESVTFYSLAIVFNAYIKTAVNSVSVLYTPKITEEATNNDHEKLQSTYDFVSKICIIILSLIVFGFVCCGREFIMMWLGADREEIYYYSLPLMLGMVFLYPQHFSIQVHRASGKQKFAAISLSLTFLLNVVLSIGLVIILSHYTNPVLGCIIGTLFTYVCESILLSCYNSKKLGLMQSATWNQVLINMMIGFMISIVVLRSFDLLDLNIRPVFIMIIKGIIYVIVFIVVQMLINKDTIMEFLRRKKNDKV